MSFRLVDSVSDGSPPRQLIVAVSYTGLGEGYGRITGVSLDLAATVRGRQPRRARIHIGGGQGVVSWTTVGHGVTQGALKVAR